MSETKRARLIECGRSTDGNEYEVWDTEDGRGIYVHFNVCPYDTHEPETMAFPYDMARRVVTDWEELGCWPYYATGGKAIRDLGYEIEEGER